MKKVFISGAISGRDLPEYEKQFNDAENYLHELGFGTWNPVKEIDSKTSWGNSMDICKKALEEECDAIFVLSGSYDSIGSRIEQALARDLKLLFMRQ